MNRNYFPSNTKQRDGFTLLELLVVIAVISLLATTVVVRVDQVRKQARDIRRLADLIQLSNALELYYADHNRYPDTCNGSGVTAGHATSYGDCDNNYIMDLSNYISRLPIDPRGDSADKGYMYYVSGDADAQQHYKLFSYNSTEEEVLRTDPFARCAPSCTRPQCSDAIAARTYSIYTPGD